MEKKYKICKDGEIIESEVPGKYAGWRPGKIFGKLDCRSGMNMKKENRVFFLTWQDAISQGYRPCKKCKPAPDAPIIIDRPSFYRNLPIINRPKLILVRVSVYGYAIV